MKSTSRFEHIAANKMNSPAAQADSRDIFETLTRAKPIKLVDLPERFGVYALWDHNGQIRYIGCTPKTTEGFRTRIYNKHTTGSEGRSHKFTQAYCTGRMWRYSKKLHPAEASVGQLAADAKAAKTLRSAFVRAYCTATYVALEPNSLPTPYFGTLTALEAQLQAMAHKDMRAWEGIRFAPLPEPAMLVDELLHAYPHLEAGAKRQDALYRRHVGSPPASQ